MKFTDEELELLDGINCYDDTISLAAEEIDSDEINYYLRDKDNWSISLAEWFNNWLSEKIYEIKNKEGTTLYFFDNQYVECDVDVEKLIKKIIEEYDVQTADDFNSIDFE